jgi:hypothetical protein
VDFVDGDAFDVIDPAASEVYVSAAAERRPMSTRR